MKIIILFFLVLNLHANISFEKKLDSLIGIKYRSDGVKNQNNIFTTFANQEKIFTNPGLNCSGFVLEASRLMLNKNFSIDEVKKDINNNSHANSPHGEDWDFGRDLVLNIANNSQKKYKILSGFKDANTSSGFDINDKNAWKKLKILANTKSLYLLTFSKKTQKKPYHDLYHHVALLIKNDQNQLKLYHATGKSGVHKVEISDNLSQFYEDYILPYGKNDQVFVLEINP